MVIAAPGVGVIALPNEYLIIEAGADAWHPRCVEEITLTIFPFEKLDPANSELITMVTTPPKPLYDAP